MSHNLKHKNLQSLAGQVKHCGNAVQDRQLAPINLQEVQCVSQTVCGPPFVGEDEDNRKWITKISVIVSFLDPPIKLKCVDFDCHFLPLDQKNQLKEKIQS